MEEENKSKGFIKLYRSLLTWEWYGDINTRLTFMHMLIRANYADQKFEGKVIPRGSFVSSRAKLSAEIGISERNLRTALNHLKMTGEVTSKSYSKYTIYTVENYDLYQGTDQQSDQQVTSDRPASDQQVTTIKEIKKSRNQEIKKIDDHGGSAADDLGEVFSVVDKSFSPDVVSAFKRFAMHWDRKPPTRKELESWLYILMELKTNADRLACIKWSSGGNPKGSWYRELFLTGFKNPFPSKEPPAEPNLPDWYAEVPEEKATKKEIDAVIALQKAVAAGDAEAAERIQATILEGEVNGNPNPIN